MVVDDQGFEALFRREHAAVLRTVRLILADQRAAEDVTQEAFCRLYVRWRRVGRYDRPGAWVRRVAIRLALRARTSEQRRPGLEAGAPGPSPDLEGLGLDVRAALEQLPLRQRCAVVLHHLDDLPVTTVAELMGCRVGTAKAHLHKGRARLAQLLHETEEVHDVPR